MSRLIVRPLISREIPAAARAVAAMLAPDDEQREQWLYRQYAQVYPHRPDPLPDVYRGAFVGDQLVSLIHLTGHILRYGRAALHVVRIGTLLTFPEHRRCGYAGALLRDTLTHAAEQGTHLVLVHAPPHNFYGRYGFSPVWPQYLFSTDSQRAAALSSPYDLRPATRTDLPYIAALYNRHWGMRVTVERSAELWHWLMDYRQGQAMVIVDEHQQIQGYIWHDYDDDANSVEITANDAAALETLLAHSGQRALQAGADRLVWCIPPDDAVISHAQQRLPMTLSAQYAPDSGQMARVIDADALVRRLLPEISAQASSPASPFDPSRLTLTVEPDGVAIGLHGLPDSFCRLPLRDFIQLLFGSSRPDMLHLRDPLPDEARHLLTRLFPPRIAALGAWDS